MSRGRRLHVVLLAGGSGTRFWPMSRAKRPKPFLALAGRASLLRQTWDRARRLAPASQVWVVAPTTLAAAVRRELPGIAARRLVIEPSPRDTAPAIALACAAIARQDPRAVALILPTDHVVGDSKSFAATVAAARRAAEDGTLLCLGVVPDRAATGFGYLRLRARPRGRTAAPVLAFVEKPDARRARRFVRSGRYLWNSGMFVWRVDSFLAEIARVAPKLARAAAGAAAGSRSAWRGAANRSLDFAVMEKARRVAVIPLVAGWDDLGSWDAAARRAPRNGRAGSTRVILGSPSSVVFGGRRMIALLDVPGIVVVDAGDALLVASRAASEKVKAVVAAVRAAGRSDLL